MATQGLSTEEKLREQLGSVRSSYMHHLAHGPDNPEWSANRDRIEMTKEKFLLGHYNKTPVFAYFSLGNAKMRFAPNFCRPLSGKALESTQFLKPFSQIKGGVKQNSFGTILHAFCKAIFAFRGHVTEVLQVTPSFIKYIDEAITVIECMSLPDKGVGLRASPTSTRIRAPSRCQYSSARNKKQVADQIFDSYWLSSQRDNIQGSPFPLIFKAFDGYFAELREVSSDSGYFPGDRDRLLPKKRRRYHLDQTPSVDPISCDPAVSASVDCLSFGARYESCKHKIKTLRETRVAIVMLQDQICNLEQEIQELNELIYDVVNESMFKMAEFQTKMDDELLADENIWQQAYLDRELLKQTAVTDLDAYEKELQDYASELELAETALKENIERTKVLKGEILELALGQEMVPELGDGAYQGAWR